MKFPVGMLREFVDTSLDAKALGALLTMAGFELEGIDEVEGEAILDIKVVSNRGDGLSVLGLAREVLAKSPEASPTDLYDRAAARFAARPTGNLPTSVSIETDQCTRYACRMFTAVRNGPSPEWLQKRMRQAGMRPISVLVDLTNYVMLELGQPLHAFDFDKLAGGRIVVRDARSGEKLTTLDGNEHELQTGQMMICDAERPVAAAGIMGGLDTEVDANTTTMLLESAHFVNTSVRRTRKQLGLSTEASYRFERSVDPEGVVAALNRFAELFERCDVGNVEPGLIDVYPSPPTPADLQLRMSRVTRLLGMPVAPGEAQRYLERLGFSVNGDGEPFSVTAPSWRPDIVREDDLVEEIGRVHGYDTIPEVPIYGTTLQGGVAPFEGWVDRLREGVVRTGFVQTIGHSLRDRHPLDDPNADSIGPRHPGSPELAYLRNSLLPSLADAAQRNGGRDLHLFEIAPVFPGLRESRSLALWSQGALAPVYRANEHQPQADFFSLKGALEEALGHAGVCPLLIHRMQALAGGMDPRFHPARQASIDSAQGLVGIIGQIHPDLAENLGVPADTVVAELNLTALYAANPPTQPAYKPVSRNPAIRRDIAILVPKNLPYIEIQSIIETAAGELLERQWLFDVYEGKGIPEGYHSLAIGLQLRKFGENLTDEEANQVRDAVVAELAKLGATQR